MREGFFWFAIEIEDKLCVVELSLQVGRWVVVERNFRESNKLTMI